MNVYAARLPNCTAVAPVKFDPVIVTCVPPAMVAEFGETPVTVGASGVGVVYVNWSALPGALVPPPVVTRTSTVPVEPAGVVAERWPASVTVKLAAPVPPKLTDVAPVRFVPVMVTWVPPAVVPEFGETPVTVGAGVDDV